MYIAPIEGIAAAETMVRAGILNVHLVAVGLKDVRVYSVVNSTNDAPIENAHIISGPLTRSTSTGSKGEYELNVRMQVNNILHTIHFQYEDLEHQRIRFSPADLDDLTKELRLDVLMEPHINLTTVTGAFKDGEGNPAGGKVLNITSSQLQILYRAQSYENGEFLFENVETGSDYQLLIRPGSDYKNVDINPLVIPDRGLYLDIVLELVTEDELSGWMIDPYGNPIPGLSMTLRRTINMKNEFLCNAELFISLFSNKQKKPTPQTGSGFFLAMEYLLFNLIRN